MSILEQVQSEAYHAGYMTCCRWALERIRTGRKPATIRSRSAHFRRGWQAACVDMKRNLEVKAK